MKRAFAKKQIRWLLTFSLIFVLSGIVTLCVSAEDTVEGTWGDNLTWQLDRESGELTVSGTGPMAVHYESEYGWYPYANDIRTVQVERGITTLCGFANCTNLTEIEIPDSVTTIEDSALLGCTSLTHLEIPRSVTVIGGSALRGCTALEELTVPFVGHTIEGYQDPHYRELGRFGYIFGATNWFDHNDDYVPTSLKTVVITGGSTIWGESFSECPGIERVVIPNTVTAIAGSAFCDCTSLREVEIPNSVTSIGMNAFLGCTALEEIAVPNSVTGMGSEAFRGCSALKRVTLSNALETIEFRTFQQCASLESITIPDSVTTIDYYAFADCTSLRSVTFGSALQSLGKNAFQNCVSLETIRFSNSLTSIAGSFVGCTSLTSVVLPDSMTNINSAFVGCTALTSVIIPDSVTDMVGAFKDCTSLTSLVVPNSVITMNGAFGGCTSLTTLTMPLVIPESENQYSNESFRVIFNGELPSSLHTVIFTAGTSIPGEFFRNCSSLRSVTLPDTLTSIGERAFVNCSSLSRLTVGSSLETIGDNAFEGCYRLVEINNRSPLDIEAGSDRFGGIARYAIEVHSGLTKIVNQDGYWFYLQGDTNYLFGCDDMGGELVLPADCFGKPYVVYTYAFFQNTSVRSMTMAGDIRHIGDYAFAGCTSLERITLPQNLSGIGDYAFAGCTSLESIILPQALTSLGGYAFSDCSSLQTVEIPSAVMEMGKGVFYRCAALTQANVPNTWTHIPDFLFQGCTSLQRVTIPTSIQSIGEGAFAGCTAFTEILIPASVITIGEAAFRSCTGLTSVTVPNSVTRIGKEAFGGCTALTSMTLPFVGESLDGTTNTHVGYIFGADHYSSNDSAVPISLKTVVINGGTSIAQDAFYHCTGLTSVVIGDSVTTIGTMAFYDCTGLESIVIGDSVTTIGTWAFYDCTGLESIVIGEAVTTIGTWAFDGCTALTSIVIGRSVTTIDAWAFEGCTALARVENHSNLPITKGSEAHGGVAYYATEVIGHTYGDWTPTDDDTHQKCCACGHVVTGAHTHGEWEEMDDNTHRKTCVCGHSVDDAHTCGAWFEDGSNHTRTCVCGYSESEAHVWDEGEITTPATHLETGVKTYTCTFCPATMTETVEKTAAHTYIAWTEEDEENHTKTCACGHSESEAHVWDEGEITTPATHLETGVKTYTCTLCSATATETVEKTTAHTYIAWTEEDEENHTKTCACGHSKSEAHTWDEGEITMPATHLETGVRTYTCTLCSATTTDIVEKTTAHTYGAWTEDGESHTRTCACGHSESEAHTWDEGEITTPATHLEIGIKTYTCTLCSATTTETVEKTAAHTYGAWTEDGESHTRTCACGHSESEAHTWDDGAEKEGRIVYTCLSCTKSKSENVAFDLPEATEPIVTSPVKDTSESTWHETEVTTAESTADETDRALPPQLGGCSSSLSASWGILLLIMMLSAMALKKKKETR